MALNKSSAFLIFAAIYAAALSGALAQEKAKDIAVGNWKLVKSFGTNSDGTTRPGFGGVPTGVLILTKDGYFSNISMRADLPSFKSGNRMEGTAEENAAVAAGSISTYGRYTVSDDGKKLVFKILGSTWKDWVGATQERELNLSKDKLEYVTKSSVSGTTTMTFERYSD